MIVKKSKGEVVELGKESTGLKYLYRGKEVGVTFMDVNGLAPQKGAFKVENRKLVYIVKGRGLVTIDGKEKKLSKSYVLVMEAGKEYAFSGKFQAVMYN